MSLEGHWRLRLTVGEKGMDEEGGGGKCEGRFQDPIKVVCWC